MEDGFSTDKLRILPRNTHLFNPTFKTSLEESLRTRGCLAHHWREGQ